MRNNKHAIAARWLRNANTKVLDRQWQHTAFNLYQVVPYPTAAAFALAFKGMAPVSPKAAQLRPKDFVDNRILDN